MYTQGDRDRNHQSTPHCIYKDRIFELDSLPIIFFQDSGPGCFPCLGHYPNLQLCWSLPSAALLGKGGTFCIVLSHFRANAHMLPASFACPFPEHISFTSRYLLPQAFASVLVVCLPQLKDSRSLEPSCLALNRSLGISAEGRVWEYQVTCKVSPSPTQFLKFYKIINCIQSLFHSWSDKYNLKKNTPFLQKRKKKKIVSPACSYVLLISLESLNPKSIVSAHL